MTALLRKADDAATVCFFELAPELRDEIYDYYLEGTTRNEAITEDELRDRLSCISKRFCEEAGDVLERGTYQFLPRTADKSSALAETVWETLLKTPARQTSRYRVSPPSLPTRINGLVMRGRAGVGKSSHRSPPPSLWTSPYYSAFDTRHGRIVTLFTFCAALHGWSNIGCPGRGGKVSDGPLHFCFVDWSLIGLQLVNGCHSRRSTVRRHKSLTLPDSGRDSFAQLLEDDQHGLQR